MKRHISYFYTAPNLPTAVGFNAPAIGAANDTGVILVWRCQWGDDVRYLCQVSFVRVNWLFFCCWRRTTTTTTTTRWWRWWCVLIC